MTPSDTDLQTSGNEATAEAGGEQREHLPAWGAVPLDGGKVRFRLWAPDIAAAGGTLKLRLNDSTLDMEAEEGGWFSLATDAAPGDAYQYLLPGETDGDGLAVPDPASRAQAGDVHGPSIVTAPGRYEWRAEWSGRPWEEAVIYEFHIGTFTDEGTFRAAIERLDHVAAAGFTAIEIMPVAQFAGTRGWGYDGVLLYAPHSAYGRPDDLRALVDAAHERGLMVLLDVVYNHFGPSGNYLNAYATDFFHSERQTPWGDAIAYDRPAVRRFVIDNVLYWLEEFRLDGLRFDAIDHVDDPSDPEILVEAAREVRARITDRPIHLTTEDNRNITRLHERGPDNSVPLFTGEWNDDLHNVAHVVATNESEGYYVDFASHRWEYLARALAEGFAYTGQVSPQTGEERGVPSAHLPPVAFVDFLQNHDQIGNRAFGERLPALASEWRVELLTSMLLLSPHIPLMFMGEEYGEERPFCFFADFEGELAESVTEGRRREFADFDAFSSTGIHHVPDPISPSTFEASKLDWSRVGTEDGRAVLDRVGRLLDLRRTHILPHLAATGGNCGRILRMENGAIAIDWHLGKDAAVILQLRANFSDEPVDLPAAEGELIHRVQDQEHGVGDTIGSPHSALHFVKNQHMT
ncbi:maltooligosyl trehalose hydrolase [Palleronia aestuarii]|uniref:Malto-oligosyltrehalose trehalohydrolase n=1 Tax=Palleronia aestuarii TaxID=568105 RepID=A0A2W7N6A5_9RHOB|nr:malto-oligosyltrehalose trehalohydrolase [Palleronia aestuarii]PZX15955.1 maltooligosyl trehalose hydrolase [Palleronia aestuarii]